VIGVNASSLCAGGAGVAVGVAGGFSNILL
jgi:hypothetical protein